MTPRPSSTTSNSRDVVPTRRAMLAGGASGLFLAASGTDGRATPADGSRWRLRLPRSAFGPLELLVTVRRAGENGLVIASSSGAIDSVRRLPGAATPAIDLSTGLWSIAFQRDGVVWRGASLASRKGDTARIDRITADTMEGEIASGWFRGTFAARAVQGDPRRLRDYPAVVGALRRVLAEKLFDPRVLQTSAVARYLSRLETVATSAQDDLDLCLAARWAWDGRPAVSHLELRRSEVSAADLAEQFETMTVGGRGVELRFDGDAAILRISTMMGSDTLQQIEAAWRTIVERRTPHVIIDLRSNPGGAFAVQPLVEPLLDAPLDVGVFASRAWASTGPAAPPGRTAMLAAPAFEGASISAFWRAMQSQPLTRIRIAPGPTRYEGRVDVLVGAGTASAAEMAADALRRTGRVRVVGEATAGQMLSGAYFDLPEGFQAYLPVADYFAGGDRRLEGSGVVPDLPTEGGDALVLARQRR